MTSRKILNNMPVYAQLADQQVGVLQGGTGILKHICDTAQVEYDQIYRILQRRQNLFNPDLCPIAFLDWLGQVVGLGAIDDHYLGIGLNPDWDIQRKREVIKRAYQYYRHKGTEWGTREAIALWLDWEKAHDPEKLLIYLPYGNTPNATRNIWEWGNEWEYNTVIDFVDRLEYGSGDYFPGQLSVAGWMVETDGVVHRPEEMVTRSHLGPRNPWFHFCFGDRGINSRSVLIENIDPIDISDLSELGVVEPLDVALSGVQLDLSNERVFREIDLSDWNNIFLDIYKLSIEAFNSLATPVFWGWIQVATESYLIESRERPRIVTDYFYELVDGHGYGDCEWDVTDEWELPSKVTTSWEIVDYELVEINVCGFSWTYDEPFNWGELLWENTGDCSTYVISYVQGDPIYQEVTTGYAMDGVVVDTIQLINIFATWNDWTFNVTSQQRELPLAERGYFEVFPDLAPMYNANNWLLVVEGNKHSYQIKPSTFYWTNAQGDRSQFFEYGQEGNNYTDPVLEFLFNVASDEDKIQHFFIKLENNVVYSSRSRLELSVDFRVNIGLQFKLYQSIV